MKKSKQNNKENKHFISIKTKLLGIILPVIIFIIVVLIGLSYYVSKKVITSNAQKLLTTSVESQVSEIEEWLDKNLASFCMVKQAIEWVDLNDKQTQSLLDSYYGFNSNFPGGIYIADMDGRLYKGREGAVRNADAVLHESDRNGNYINNDKFKGDEVVQSEWFQDALSRVNMGFTNAYTNENGEQVISACGMLRSNNKGIYVISADLSLDKISVYVNSFVKMENAEAFLVNTEDNTVLASRDTSLILKSLDSIDNSFMRKAGEKIAQNNLDLAEIDGNMSVFEKIDGTEWVLVSYVPSEIVYSDLNFIRNIMVLFGIISIVILMVLIERITHIVIKPVKKLTEIIKTMTEGNFTISSHTKSHDEIGIMGRCVEKFIDAMTSMISSINGVSGALHGQADKSKNISEQMFCASKEQNKSMKELNNTVEQLSLSVGEIAQSATTLAMLVEETKDNGDGVNNKMKETIHVSKTGKQAMQDVSTAMGDINSSVTKLQSAIDEVGKASEEITNITKVIGDIADETNLLSLNASIEAARAGDAGKGFAVVAMEIGKLAQTSVASVQHIDNLVLEIKTSVQDVVSQANDSVKSINSSSVLIKDAVNTFDIIFENIDVTGNLIQNMIQKVEQVEDVARNVAAISEEQAASSEEILGSSNILVEQANSLMESSETVAKSSEQLTTSAEELSTQIGIFKI